MYDNDIAFTGYRLDTESGLYYAPYRYQHPGLGLFVTRDPLGYKDGMNLYGYCGGRPVGWVDALGLRNLTIRFYYNFDTIVLTPDAREETERIFRECFDRCIPKSKEGCPIHKVEFQWVRTGETADNLELGGQKGNLFGFNPTIYSVFLRENPRMRGRLASTVGNSITINPRNVEDARDQIPLDRVLGGIIAHEAGLHAIGGWLGLGPFVQNAEHFHESAGYIDDRWPSFEEDQVFSPEACKEICDELDVDK